MQESSRVRRWMIFKFFFSPQFYLWSFPCLLLYVFLSWPDSCMLVLKQDSLWSKSQERGRLLSPLIRYRIWNWFFNSLLYLINISSFLGVVWFRIIRRLNFQYGSPFPLITSVMSIFILYSRECLCLWLGTYPKFDCLGENSLFCACKSWFRSGRKEVGQILYLHILI